MNSQVIHSPMTWGQIQEAIAELGWSQASLARRIRRHPSMMSKVKMKVAASAPILRLATNAIERERERRRSA